MLKNRGAALALAVLFVLAGYGVWISSSYEPPYHQTVNRSYQRPSQQLRPESPEERLADYTGALAWFTGLLALVSAVQIYFLTKADKTARISADAAKKSAEAAETAFNKLERPYLFIYNAETEGIAAVVYVVANHGRTPAIIDNFRAIISSGFKPVTPIRVNNQHELLVARVIAPNDIYRPTEHAPDGIAFITTSSGNVVPQLKEREDVFLWIIVSYRGAFTKGHVTSVCWRYDNSTNSLVQWGHEDYNYVR